MPLKGLCGVSPGADGADQTKLFCPSSAQVGDAQCKLARGRTPGARAPSRGGPVLPLGPGCTFALPHPPSLPAGGGAGARRPGAPPPPPRQAEAARWRRRRPRGRGRSAQLAASLLPREAAGTLSRAAAPRPAAGPGLGHGGTRRRRARAARECEAKEESARGAPRSPRGGARGRPLGAVGRSQAVV